MYQEQINAVIRHFFPNCDFFSLFQPDNRLYIYKMVFETHISKYSISAPPGFMLTEIHVDAPRVAFTLVAPEEVFLQLYPPTPFYSPTQIQYA